ncbi:Arginine biosynthesis bifunctional protein ArgJ [Natranaerofaba carboxydovora]|nr:bifunctional ornithine acetyltransferase/N-acetylglutamate synthase [Natranaerofaba carboxydovora]UMZ74571.1 Arginine biosynthesis bifunctional protein ArgJ [Natranaerofaba carboxydovora]
MGITSPKGYLAEGIHCGVRKSKSKLDLAMVKSEHPTTAAGTYTKNKFVAPPVVVTKDHIDNANPRAIVVNSGLANACTGEQGMKDAEEMAECTAKALGIKKEEVIVGSTGLIGEYLPMEKLKEGIENVAPILSKDGNKNAALAIMTTDTKPKEASVTTEIDGKEITIGGMAKGSGMIYPNMATMFGFVTTDVAISKPLLNKALFYSVDRSYNLMTVDGDTSTNDMVIALANGAGENKTIDQEDENYFKFRDALTELNKKLSMMIVSDGEGTTKVIKLYVKQAKTFEDAKRSP